MPKGSLHFSTVADVAAKLGPRAAAQARAAVSEDAKRLIREEAAKVSRSVLGAEKERAEKTCIIPASDLEPRREELVLEFPDLVLGSVNTMLGAKFTRQTPAKKDAERAVRLLATRWRLGTARLWRMPGRVDVIVTQFSIHAARIDADNLHAKGLLDLLTASHFGIAIIPDDSPRYVRRITKGHAAGPVRVEVRFVPAMEEVA